MSGHISVRDPEDPHKFWTNPLGKYFGALQPSDMILVDYSGTAVGGNTRLTFNAAGFQIHSAVHKARPDVIAACHTHSTAGRAWSAFSRRLDMLNQDVTQFYGDAQAVYSEFGGVVFNEAEAYRLAMALGPKGKGMTLRNHGLLTVGKTVDEAAYLFMLMEKSCEVQLLVEAAAANGIDKVYINDDIAEYTYRMTSDSEALYCEFQPDLCWERECLGGKYSE
jgi:ribulose-5-phosphate 4-epimerase/fuculose-1-phosphate aldolase